MAVYQLYCLDEKGRIINSHDIPAKNDENAISAAREMKLGTNCELWARSRKVAQIAAVPIVERPKRPK